MVLIAGPRQAGKTTLAKSIGQNLPHLGDITSVFLCIPDIQERLRVLFAVYFFDLSGEVAQKKRLSPGVGFLQGGRCWRHPKNGQSERFCASLWIVERVLLFFGYVSK